MLSVEPDAIEIIALSIKKLAQNHFDQGLPYVRCFDNNLDTLQSNFQDCQAHCVIYGERASSASPPQVVLCIFLHDASIQSLCIRICRLLVGATFVLLLVKQSFSPPFYRRANSGYCREACNFLFNEQKSLIHQESIQSLF